eukprot:2645876-Pleurochrysis_carterae.AAC.3
MNVHSFKAVGTGMGPEQYAVVVYLLGRFLVNFCTLLSRAFQHAESRRRREAIHGAFSRVERLLVDLACEGFYNLWYSVRRHAAQGG